MAFLYELGEECVWPDPGADGEGETSYVTL